LLELMMDYYIDNIDNIDNIDKYNNINNQLMYKYNKFYAAIDLDDFYIAIIDPNYDEIMLIKKCIDKLLISLENNITNVHTKNVVYM
jgi:hypothetical protein